MTMQQWLKTVVSVALIVTACDADQVAPIPTPVESIVVTPAALELETGEVQRVEALVRAPDGSTLTGRPVQWTSQNEQIARVSALGIVTAVGTGTTRITASSGGKQGSSTIRVREPNGNPPPSPEVAFIEIYGDSVRVMQRQTSTILIAIPRDAAGNPLNDIPIAWSTSDEAVAWLTDTGGVVARRGGSAIVTATAQGKSASVHIEVPRVVSVTLSPHVPYIGLDTPVQLTATVMTEAGVVAIPVQWTSETPQIAAVDAQGRVSTVRAGIARIRATAEGVTGLTIVIIAGNRVNVLGSANGQTLPVRLHEILEPYEAGALHRLRVVVASGTLRLNANGTYYHRLRIHLEKDGVLYGTREEIDMGTVTYDFLTGDPILVSDTHEGRVTRVEHEYVYGLFSGNMTVLARVEGEQVRLYYTQ